MSASWIAGSRLAAAAGSGREVVLADEETVTGKCSRTA
jgi:hypothetical protein